MRGAVPAARSAGLHGSSDDLLRTYLRDIGRHPLLSHEQEVVLAKEIEAGVRASGRLDRGGLVGPARLRAVAQVEAAAAARRTFVQANLRLVVAVARRYQGFGLPLLDLIQDGNLGLLRAVEKYDWRRGFKFSTYATWWIRQGVTRGLADTARTIRAPVHVVEILLRLRKTTEQLMERLGTEPSDAELASALGMDVGRLHDYRRLSREPTSLHAAIGEDGEGELHTLLGDDGPDPMDLAVSTTVRDGLHAILRGLAPRDRRILELRFGFADGEPKTLEQIGREFGLTRERIRQIEQRAMTRLRHPSMTRELEGFRS